MTISEGTKPGLWHEGLTEAVIEVKQIAADLENSVELMRKSGLTHAFGRVRTMVAAVGGSRLARPQWPNGRHHPSTAMGRAVVACGFDLRGAEL
jgi:hypothetical protein